MEVKKLIKLQNAIIRAHQKIKDVQDNSNNQTKEIKSEFKKEVDSLNKIVGQLNEELNGFTKKEELGEHNKKLEGLKMAIDELNASLDKKISEIELTPGKDGKNGLDGMPGKDGRDGKDGKDGKPGLDGKDGKDGCNGLSAYEIAVKQGFEGTEKEWIDRITNSGGKSYLRQLTAINQRINQLYEEIKEVPEDALTQASILKTIEECEQCTGEQVPAANLMAMTYNSIPRAVSEVENDAGYITEETDPYFTNSVAYSINQEDINNWNSKVEDENYVHTDNNFTDEDKEQITTNKEDISKLDNEKATKEEVEKITPKTYTAKLDIEGVLLETNASYESITNDMRNNTPINLLLEWNNEQISMDIAEIKTNIDNPHIMFLGHVRNADSSFLFWFYVQSNNQNFCEIKSVDNELLMLDASLNVSGALVSTTAEYEAIKEAVLKDKEVIIQTTWHEETFYMRLGEWKAGYTPPYFSFYGFVRDGYVCREFFLHIGQNGEHTFADNRAYQMKDELIKDWNVGDITVNGPTAELCYNSFMRKPVIIYDNDNGFEASNDDAGDTWHLTGLDLKPYKRLKFYVRSGGDGDANYSPSHIVEMHLDDRAKGSFGYFSADHAGHCPNNRNRHHMVTFIVNAEKTAIQFQHSISIYGTAASNSAGGRSCYLIEGYYD